MDHKLISWGEYSIPVKPEFDYMAFDADGTLVFFVKRPQAIDDIWSAGSIWCIGMSRYEYPFKLDPPESLLWLKQIYLINDGRVRRLENGS